MAINLLYRSRSCAMKTPTSTLISAERPVCGQISRTGAGSRHSRSQPEITYRHDRLGVVRLKGHPESGPSGDEHPPSSTVDDSCLAGPDDSCAPSHWAGDFPRQYSVHFDINVPSGLRRYAHSGGALFQTGASKPQYRLYFVLSPDPV